MTQCSLPNTATALRIRSTGMTYDGAALLSSQADIATIRARQHWRSVLDSNNNETNK